MRTQAMRKLLCAVMSVVMLVTMLCAAMPTVIAETAEETAAVSNILPQSIGDVKGDGSALATAHALSVTTNGTSAVTVPLNNASFYVDENGFNALALSVNTSQKVSLALTLSKNGETKELTTAAHFGTATLVDENGMLPAGDRGTIVLNIVELMDWTSGTVTITDITVTTAAAGTVVFYGMAATTADAAPTGGNSLLPTATGDWNVEPKGNSTFTIVEKQAPNGWSLTSTDGNNPSASYEIAVSNRPVVSLFSSLRYNFNVSQGATILLYFNYVNNSAFDAEQVINDSNHASYVRLNSLFAETAIDSGVIPAGHYEGEISLAKVVNDLYPAYIVTEPVGSTPKKTVQDLVLNDMVQIQGIKVFTDMNATEDLTNNMTLYDFSVVEPAVVNGPLDLMPSAQVVENIESVSYDDGQLTYTASAKESVTIPIGKYVDIETYKRMAFRVSAQTQGTGSDGFSWDVGFTVKRLHPTNDGNTTHTVTLWNDWGSAGSDASSSSHEYYTKQKATSVSNYSANQDISGSLTWNGILAKNTDAGYNNAHNRVAYVENIVLKLGSAGTMTIDGLCLTDETSFTPSLPTASLSLDEVKGKPGETVEVSLRLDSAMGLSNFDVAITYDNTALTIDRKAIRWNTDMLAGNSTDADGDEYATTTPGFYIANIVTDATENTLKLAYIANEVNTANVGAIVTIPVTISEDAPARAYPLTMTVGDVNAYTTVYTDEASYDAAYGTVALPCESTNGKIAVTHAAEPITVKVGEDAAVYEVYSSKTVVIPVTISEGHFLQSGTVTVTYDATVLDITADDIVFAEGYKGTKTVENGTITVVLNNPQTVVTAGNMFYLNFKAKTDIAEETTVALTMTISDMTAAQGGASYPLPCVTENGSVLVKKVNPETRKVTLTASPAATAVGKNDIVKVELKVDASAPVTSFTDLVLTFDPAQMTPVLQDGNGYVAWDTGLVGNATSTCENGAITMNSTATGNTTLKSGTLGAIYFVMNTNDTQVTVTLTGATATLYMPDEFDATNDAVEALIVNCYGGSFTVGVVTTTTTATTLPSLKEGQVQFILVSSSSTVATNQTVTVDIVLNTNLNNGEGVQNFGLKLTSDAFTPVETNGAWVAWNTEFLGVDGNNPMYIARKTTNGLNIGYILAGDNTAASGVIGTVTFTVNADASTSIGGVAKTIDIVCTEVTYDDATHPDADDYGDVTPADEDILTQPAEFTVYPSYTVNYYKTQNDTTPLATRYFIDNGDEQTYPTPEGVSVDHLNYTFRHQWKVTSVDNETSTINVCPIYGYTVEVVGGTLDAEFISGKKGDGNGTGDWMTLGTKAFYGEVREFEGTTNLFGYDRYAQVTADIPDGKVFSHWSDQYGNIVSYKSEYRFYVPSNLLLIANYADEDATPENAPKAALQAMRSETVDSVTAITWVCAVNVGNTSKYTIKEYGIVLSPKNDYTILTGPASSTAVKVSATEGCSNHSSQYSVTLTGVKAGKNRYAVAYTIYLDADGAEYTVYSPVHMGMTTPAQ